MCASTLNIFHSIFSLLHNYRVRRRSSTFHHLINTFGKYQCCINHTTHSEMIPFFLCISVFSETEMDPKYCKLFQVSRNGKLYHVWRNESNLVLVIFFIASDMSCICFSMCEMMKEMLRNMDCMCWY